MSNKRYVLSIAGIFGGGIIFCLFLLALLAYPTISWPSPQPYKDTEIEINEGPIGSWGFARTQTYNAPLSMNDMQMYYDNEMESYCISDWQFEIINDAYKSSANKWGLEELPELIENSTCREAKCEIRRWSLSQGFEVLICSEPNSLEQTTIVVQQDLWED